jgi:hypothetical protein
MRYLIIAVASIFIFISCKKDKGNSAPQIKYKSITPTFLSSSSSSAIKTEVDFEITDADGDIGYNVGADTSYVFLKNILTGTMDSAVFPNLSAVPKSNFKATVSVALDKVIKCKSLPGNVRHTDTLFFEVYVKDFAKNKSNVITTEDALLFNCQ